MKNLFKNLMLVAVAAMAFTACTETNDEVNAVVNKTRYEFTANIAEETRSGFAEKEEGATAYKSEWFGNETLKIFVTDYGSYNVETTADINAEGQFDLELENAPESFFITAVSPAESWVSEYTATIPAVQTPLANSVDPKAHLLQAQAVPVSGNSGDINFTHMAAYGKMTVKDVDFAIDHVVVDLKGSYYGYDRELSYTINATNVENNTFWFATEPIDVAKFTVTAYDAEGNAVTKTVDVAEAGKTMSFQYGRVGTFSVSGLEEYTEPVGPMFTSAETSSYGQDKYIYFYSDDNSLSTLKINAFGCFGDNDDIWIAGVYSHNWSNSAVIYTGIYSTYDGIEINEITVTVSHVNEGYKIVIENVYDRYGNMLLEKATYIGEISGLAKPDPRVKLDTPNVTSTISGKTITMTWEAVANAESYLIEGESLAEPISTTELTATITLPTYDYCYFYVQAVVDANSTEYRSSDKTYVEYNDPREPLASPANLKAEADGNNVTITWDSVEGADSYSVYVDGTLVAEKIKATSYLFEADYGTYYNIRVVANVVEGSTDYRNSDSAYTYITTPIDIDGIEANYNVTLTGYTINKDSSYGKQFEFTSDDSMLRINLPVNPNLPDELPAGIYTGVYGSSSFSSGAALEFNYYDTQYWCSSLMSGQWFGDKCGVKVTREDNGDWSIIMINYNWTYGYVKYVYNETVSQSESESKEFTLASLDEKTYNSNKYGFEYSFATEDGNVYGSIYINNGMNTSELVEGTYAFHNMYGDVYIPGFTATLRDKNNGDLQSLASGSMVVTAENVVITLNDYILVYTFESTVTPEPEPEVYTDFAETAEKTVVYGQDGYVSATYTLANGTWIETADDYNYGSYTTTQEGNVYKFSFTDEKNKRNVVITYTEETGGDTPADVTLTFTKDLTSEYGSGYEDYCYYELTSGADVIGFWIFNNKSDKHYLYDGTYTNGTSINHVAYNTSSGVFIEDITIDGQYISRTNNCGAQASSSIVISNQGGHVVINLDYVDGGAEVKSRTYEFNGTIN